jgi:hypothetical protein
LDGLSSALIHTRKFCQREVNAYNRLTHKIRMASWTSPSSGESDFDFPVIKNYFWLFLRSLLCGAFSWFSLSALSRSESAARSDLDAFCRESTPGGGATRAWNASSSPNSSLQAVCLLWSDASADSAITASVRKHFIEQCSTIRAGVTEVAPARNRAPSGQLAAGGALRRASASTIPAPKRPLSQSAGLWKFSSVALELSHKSALSVLRDQSLRPCASSHKAAMPAVWAVANEVPLLRSAMN